MADESIRVQLTRCASSTPILLSPKQDCWRSGLASRTWWEVSFPNVVRRVASCATNVIGGMRW